MRRPDAHVGEVSFFTKTAFLRERSVMGGFRHESNFQRAVVTTEFVECFLLSVELSELGFLSPELASVCLGTGHKMAINNRC